MAKGRRADLALVAAGLFDSRAKAVEAIEAGLVIADGRPVLKPSMPLARDAVIDARPAHPWVSRGGIKLAAGLDAFGIDPFDCRCLDVGASTGGFTQVLLSRGARHVVAVDVGRDQLHAELGADPRVSLLEGRDARTLDPASMGGPVERIVCDVSFISLRLVLPPVFALAASGAEAVVLVKPQFEAGPQRVRKGLVRDPSVHEEICAGMAAFVASLGWTVLGLMPSPIRGHAGNREFLLGARRSGA